MKEKFGSGGERCEVWSNKFVVESKAEVEGQGPEEVQVRKRLWRQNFVAEKGVKAMAGG